MNLSKAGGWYPTTSLWDCGMEGVMLCSAYMLRKNHHHNLIWVSKSTLPFAPFQERSPKGLRTTKRLVLRIRRRSKCTVLEYNVGSLASTT